MALLTSDSQRGHIKQWQEIDVICGLKQELLLSDSSTDEASHPMGTSIGRAPPHADRIDRAMGHVSDHEAPAEAFATQPSHD